MKRENGYLLIDDLTFIEKAKVGAFSCGWYTDGVEKYLLKYEDKLETYRELFYPLIIKKLGLEAVENDLAKKEGQTGIISKSFNINHNPVYLLSEVYYAYYKKNSWDSKYYSLENMEKIIKYFALKKNVNYEKDIMDDFYNQFIIQVLLGNTDLNCGNISITLNDKIAMCPFYDFGDYGESINTNMNQNPFKFQAKTTLDNYPNSYQKTINNFFDYASKKKIELFKEYLEKIKSINLNETIKLIKEKTEYNIPIEITYKLKKELKNNIKKVDKTLIELGIK